MGLQPCTGVHAPKPRLEENEHENEGWRGVLGSGLELVFSRCSKLPIMLLHYLDDY